MAEVKENILTEGISGKIGNKIVFRQWGGRTIVSARSRTTEVTSDKQRAQRNRFIMASIYAKAQMLDPLAKAVYEVMAKRYELTSPYAAAVADYLKGPELLLYSTNTYADTPGDVIEFMFKDNAKVQTLTVTITKADTTVVETGTATFTAGDTEWKYTTTQTNDAVSGSKISITATDKFGNVTVSEEVLT